MLVFHGEALSAPPPITKLDEYSEKVTVKIKIKVLLFDYLYVKTFLVSYTEILLRMEKSSVWGTVSLLLATSQHSVTPQTQLSGLLMANLFKLSRTVQQ
jgi:hypothetical protein